MKFVNEVNEQYLEGLKKIAIDEYMETLPHRIKTAYLFIFGGVIVMAITYYPLYESVTDSMVLYALIFGFVCFIGLLLFVLGLAWIFAGYQTLKKGLSNIEKESIYQDCLDIRNHMCAMETYTLLQGVNLLKCDIDKTTKMDGETYIVVSYETKENIVEEEDFCAVVKQHTKIMEKELHLTAEGLVLYVPYISKI